MFNLGGTLLFVADDGVHGHELWKSDGTAAGTVLVKDIHPDGDSYPSEFSNANGTLFFTAFEDVNGEELWKTDGTEAGTVLVKVIAPGTSQFTSGPYNLVAVGSTLFFVLSAETPGVYQLWKSDGTAAGTIPLKDFSHTNLVGGEGESWHAGGHDDHEHRKPFERNRRSVARE